MQALLLLTLPKVNYYQAKSPSEDQDLLPFENVTHVSSVSAEMSFLEAPWALFPGFFLYYRPKEYDLRLLLLTLLNACC